MRKEAAVQKKVLSVRVKKVQSENAISHFAVRESQRSKDTCSTFMTNQSLNGRPLMKKHLNNVPQIMHILRFMPILLPFVSALLIKRC